MSFVGFCMFYLRYYTYFFFSFFTHSYILETCYCSNKNGYACALISLFGQCATYEGCLRCNLRCTTGDN